MRTDAIARAWVSGSAPASMVRPSDPVHTPILVGGEGTIDDAVEFLRTGSLGRTMLAGADPDTQARAIASVRTALAPYADEEGVRLGAAVWLVRVVA